MTPGFIAALLAIFSASVFAGDGEDCNMAIGYVRLAACTRVIESGSGQNASLSPAYNNRALAWEGEGDYGKAIADFNEAIRLNPQDAVALNNRGNVWVRKGDADRAIADYSEAIRLDPQNAMAYMNRGGTWRNTGNHDRAIADYSEAIRLNPQNAIAFNKRGHARFIKGEFSSAAADFAEAQRLKPDVYYSLMLYLARWRDGKVDKDELALNTKGMNDTKWPAPIVALYLGKIKSGTVIPQAADPEPKTHKGQLCEANYYLGEWHLLRDRKQRASEFLTKARNDCPRDYFEYYNASAELDRIW